MTRHFAVAAVAVVAAGLGLTGWKIVSDRLADPYAACRGGQVGGGAIGGPFTLVDQTGRSVTDREVITRPSLVYFGYTFCPDVCPLDNQRNAEAVDILEERGFAVTPVFISVDPARDTPDVLAQFAENLHPAMIALTGSEEQVRAASQAYRVYSRIQDPDEEFYLVDHSTFTYLVAPESGFLEFFKRDATPDQMADRVACFLQAG
ncbi:MAG TPA: SCO family protein [Paracoccaceae bacterium]|nr:SCO family protein [Paracoccaceae bacterium]